MAHAALAWAAPAMAQEASAPSASAAASSGDLALVIGLLAVVNMALVAAVCFLWLRSRRLWRLQAGPKIDESNYRRLFDTVSDLIYAQDLSGHFLRLNRACETILGYKAEEIQGKTGADLMPPEHRRAFYSEYIPRLKEQGYYEGVGIYLAKDGSKRYLEYRSTLVHHPGLGSAISGVARDVTRQKMAERALRASEERYRNLIDNIGDFIYTHDLQGRFLSINRKACESLGYTPEDIIGTYIGDLMPPEMSEAFTAEYLPALEKGPEVFGGVSKYLAKDGSEHIIEWRNRLMREPGKPTYVSGSGRDITERVMVQREMRLLEEQLSQSQKMEAVGVLAGGIAHDFNNILQVISGYVQLLLHTKDESDADRAQLEKIDRSVKRAAELVKGLLTFSRKAEHRPRRIDLNAEVKEAVHLLERTLPKMIRFVTNLAPELRPIVADPGQVEQVIVNLASNARDAMPEGGTLTLETAMVRRGEGEDAAMLDLPAGDYVMLTVSDTGMGMDSQTREHIFEPFFTTKEVGKGTGLGLATVYGIIRSHNGSITCQSEPGRGASFQVYFPAAQGAGSADDAMDQWAAEVQGGQEVILLVDDERAILDIAQNALEHHGYQVMLAESGEKALEVLQQCQGRVDLVVLDLGMPGMGGRRCLRQMLKEFPGLKVLIASGYASLEQVGNSVREGAAGFIGKPYRLEDLLRKARRLLDQGRPSR